MAELAQFAVVALTEDLPNLGLSRGQIGTIVEILADDVYEVEFSADNGETYAMAPIPGAKLIRLHRDRVSDAA